MTAEAGRPQAPSAAAAAPTRLGLVYFALVAATLAPLAIWPIPPSFDLVNHWARLTLYHMAPGDPLAALYQVRLTPIPDLAVDLAGFALSPLVTPYGVIALAWGAAIALPAWGAWRIGKAAHGAPQPAVLLAPALAYNLVITLGLLNFAIGMGLALIAFAAWLTIDRRRLPLRIALFNLVSAVLFFCHLAAFAAFGLLVAVYESPRRAGESPRDWAMRALSTVCCLLAGFALWAFAPPIDSRLSGPGSKLAALAAPMYDWTAAAGVLGTLALIVVVAGGILTRRVAFAPAMRLPLVGVAAVVALAPSAHGAADFIDARLAVLLAYLALASLQGPRGSAGKSLDRRAGGRAGRGAGRPGGAALGAIRRLGDGISRGDPRSAAGRARARRRAAGGALSRARRRRLLPRTDQLRRHRPPRAGEHAVHRTRHAAGRRPRSAPRRDAVDPAPSRLARQSRLARPLRHADRLARRLRLAAGRGGPRADRRNAASDDLPPALRPDLAGKAIRIMSGRFRNRPGDGRRREE